MPVDLGPRPVGRPGGPIVVEVRAPAADWHGRVMGTEAHLRVLGPPDLVEAAATLLADLEQRWSRFLPTSVLSELNRRAGGGPLAVDDTTFAVIDHAVKAWQATGGLYDPTVLDALEAAGYDRSFTEGLDRDWSGRQRRDPPAVPTPAGGHLVLDPRDRSVRLGAGVHLDLGGIGKGRAADVVAGSLMAEGAIGGFVNLGGDLRSFGAAPTDSGGWLVALDDHRPPSADHRSTGGPTVLLPAGGALATSAITRRRWTGPNGHAHHLIDPRTGRPADTDLLAVTVIGAEAAWAEVVAKAALVAGAEAGAALVTSLRLPALLTPAGADPIPVGNFEEYVP